MASVGFHDVSAPARLKADRFGAGAVGWGERRRLSRGRKAEFINRTLYAMNTGGKLNLAHELHRLEGLRIGLGTGVYTSVTHMANERTPAASSESQPCMARQGRIDSLFHMRASVHL